MRRTLLLFTIVLALLLLTTMAALAQEAEEVVFCGDLSEADCALLNAAQTAQWGLTSGETAKAVSVYTSGFPRLASEGPALTFNNRSMFVADGATIDKMLSLQEEDLEQMVEDPQLLAEAMLLPFAIDSASTSTVALAPEVLALLSQALGRELPAELTYETRLIDGVVYVNLADLAVLIPQADSLGEWIGIDLMAFMPQIVENNIAEGEVDLDDVAKGILTPGQAMLVQPYLVMIEPGQEQMFGEFLEILPLRDVAIDGEIAAVYRMKMDVPGYVASPAFQARFGSGEAGIPEYSSGVDFTGILMRIVSSVLASNAEAMVIQGIGYDDAYVHAQDMQMGWGLAGRNINVQIQSGNANLNNIEAIPVPANAFVPPIRLIMGLIETFQGGE